MTIGIAQSETTSHNGVTYERVNFYTRGLDTTLAGPFSYNGEFHLDRQLKTGEEVRVPLIDTLSLEGEILASSDTQILHVHVSGINGKKRTLSPEDLKILVGSLNKHNNFLNGRTLK